MCCPERVFSYSALRRSEHSSRLATRKTHQRFRLPLATLQLLHECPARTSRFPNLGRELACRSWLLRERFRGHSENGDSRGRESCIPLRPFPAAVPPLRSYWLELFR